MIFPNDGLQASTLQYYNYITNCSFTTVISISDLSKPVVEYVNGFLYIYENFTDTDQGQMLRSRLTDKRNIRIHLSLIHIYTC